MDQPLLVAPRASLLHPAHVLLLAGGAPALYAMPKLPLLRLPLLAPLAQPILVPPERFELSAPSFASSGPIRGWWLSVLRRRRELNPQHRS